MERVRPPARRRILLAATAAALVGLPQFVFSPQALASSGSWTQLAATGPGARNRAVMVYDAAQNDVVLFGGLSPSGPLDDTWTWNGSAWTQLQPPSSPSARAAAGAAYDAATGRVILFGGVISINGKLDYLGDTWSWDGVSWTQLHPASSPSARQLADMAYDPTSGTIVLFGGHNGGALGDTWTWNGTTWTQATVAVSPAPRVESSMATDDATSSVVLFGGFSTGGTEDGDTWTWRNGAWTQLSPYPAPSARSGAAMAYDAAQSHLVLFGGGCCSYPATTTDQDTWTFDGTRWTLAGFSIPSARQYAAAASVGPQGTVLLFGGQTSSGDGADLWQWNDNPLPAHPTAGILVGEYPGIGCSTGPSTCGSESDPNGVQQAYIGQLTGWEGRHDAIINTYAGWEESDGTLFTRTLPGIWNNGSVPSISWNPITMGTEVADAGYDGYLIGFAEEMKQFLAGPDGVYGNGDDRRVYLRLAWEMNGDWFSWMPARDGDDVVVDGKTPLGPQSCSSLAAKEVAFVAAWRHIHDVIVGQGLDNRHLAWDFSVNNQDVDTGGCDDGSLMEHLFPGDAYVDWVGIDGYNGSGATSPSAVFGPMATRLRAISARPLAVDEVGTPPSSAYPKGQWITDYFSYLSANGFRKSTWFNIDKEEPWAVFQPPSYADGNGDGSLSYGGTTYHLWNEYAAGVNGSNMIGADESNPRLLSDSDFLGL